MRSCLTATFLLPALYKLDGRARNTRGTKQTEAGTALDVITRKKHHFNRRLMLPSDAIGFGTAMLGLDGA